VPVSASTIWWRLLRRAGAAQRADFTRDVLRLAVAAAGPVFLGLLGDYFISAVGKARPAPLRLEFDNAYRQVSESFAELDPERFYYRNKKEEDRGGQF
jgi:hypothetical protein